MHLSPPPAFSSLVPRAQLFSIGVWELNGDGTRVLDSSGNPVSTYDTDDIMDMARAWTGFVGQPVRGNIEGRALARPRGAVRLEPRRFSNANCPISNAPHRRRRSARPSAWESVGNFVDPMELVAEHRDHFPKKSIRGGYVGDGLPLCSDLPERPWTRRGATWRLLGDDPSPHMEEPDSVR